MNRRDLIAALAASAATGVPLAVQAQPATIKYVVPFPPGGLTDVMARIAGQKLGDALKVSVVVENKPGGNAQIGAEAVAKGPADGSQILAVTLTHAANVTLFPHAPYDFVRDLRPVALLAGSPMLVVVPESSAVKTFADLVAVSRQKTLNAGSSGNGTPPHLTMALFNDINGSRMTHVPYKGGAPSMTDLIGGQLDVIFSNYPESIAHVKGGRLRALALCSAARHAQLPDVPTTAEAGMPRLLVESWTAAMAPARTPDALVDRYARELIKALYSPEIEERAKALGFRPSPMGGEAFASFLTEEIERWGRIIKAANISVG
ncbi:Bug family tripartite tricarboxylate transporter substrate binding protein [Pseudorhodoferax sp.]|uniref:Bug family tripartite tricarboxylate transporter substrate binding protein n=1 Tax=Pseudorhodoferax sp. TaxID=1993553 RepID=UPI002DD65C2E|nr:tripartite tricarboxylate transporter substrate binding protein [Pseudorhodoferax sp.]